MSYLYYLLGYDYEEELDDADPRQLELRKLLMEQIVKSKVKLKKTKTEKTVAEKVQEILNKYKKVKRERERELEEEIEETIITIIDEDGTLGEILTSD